MHGYTHPHPIRFTDDHDRPPVVEARRHPRLARVMNHRPAPRPPAHNPTYDAVVQDHGYDPLGEADEHRSTSRTTTD